jgi:superfamily II DNA or RNA helicase
MDTGKEGDTSSYPTPHELWNMTFPKPIAWRDRFAAIPYPDKSGAWSIRFYQEISVNRVLEAIEEGKDRVLLTLATGTGKTSIAFQIAWKLFNARWNLTDWKNGAPATRRPRILFLADRNNLADQAFNDFTSFTAFPDDALVRIKPEDIRKKGKVPKNGSIFFTIFQTFMSGPPKDGKPSPYFGEYPPDFFDFIIIDECHRGGANDESTWRDILKYFAPAVQLGLTATPKRQENADTYAYFGEPVYIYSLKDGINDGFLTPFRVKQITTSLDEYVYTSDDKLIEGEIEIGDHLRKPISTRSSRSKNAKPTGLSCSWIRSTKRKRRLSSVRLRIMHWLSAISSTRRRQAQTRTIAKQLHNHFLKAGFNILRIQKFDRFPYGGQPGTVNVNTVRPYKGYAAINYDVRSASASYNSVQVDARRRFKNGFLFEAAYTYSRSLGSQVGQNQFVNEKGPTAYDRPQSFTIKGSLRNSDDKVR